MRGDPRMAYMESQYYALDSARDVVRTETDTFQMLQEVADILRHEVEHYEWVGIYVVEGQELVLHAYSGDRESPRVRLPLSTDTPHGRAGKHGKIVNVPDVPAFDGDLPVFDWTRSALIAPLLYEPGGVVDIQSTEPQAFDDNDEEVLEQVAELLGEGIDRVSEDRLL